MNLENEGQNLLTRYFSIRPQRLGQEPTPTVQSYLTRGPTINHICTQSHGFCYQHEEVQSYQVPRRPANLLFFTMQFHCERYHSRLRHLMDSLVVHQHNLLWLRRQVHIPDLAARQTHGFTADAFTVPALRLEDLATIEDGLESLHAKLSAMEEDAAMFLSELLEGLVAQISFLHNLVSSSLQELTDIHSLPLWPGAPAGEGFAQDQQAQRP